MRKEFQKKADCCGSHRVEFHIRVCLGQCGATEMSCLRAEMKRVFPQFWAWGTNRVLSCRAVTALSSELADGHLLGSVLTLGGREREFQPGVTQQGPGALLLLRLLLRSPLPPLQNERVGFRLGPWRLPKAM